MQVWFWRSIVGFARTQYSYIVIANFSAELSSGASSLASIIGALKWCRKARIPNEGKAVHAQVIKHGFFRDIFIANNLISMYCDFKFPEDASKLFDEMPERNTVSWTVLISLYNRAGNPSEALRTFIEMLDVGIEEPNIHTFSAALKACAMLKDLGMGKWPGGS
ncbi:hypothetical protein HPP92_001085 [Vanilla planifolia]|uniref:Pentatricopeptide repeat-containing protein n=1 Tax=Vanilla planifolia TaxID=51239 RepID=A0A835RVM6_VANPL|nr:hypothetical protein HPP92_001085 [Vanilla planifolia]